MNILEAVAHLDGHTIITTETADAVCKTLEVPPYSKQLVMSWQSRQEALDTYGFVAIHDGPGSGVDGLDLSYHVTTSLGIDRPGSCFSGVGLQARTNQQAIRQKMSELGKL